MENSLRIVEQDYVEDQINEDRLKCFTSKDLELF